jgi:hypothetical protein
MPKFSSNLVSVIIPVFNRPSMLTDAVNSVFAQSHSDFEIIIVDDGSTDSTPDIIQNLVISDPRVDSIRLPNGGPGLAREAGRVRAKGNFIQYLDSDDLLTPKKFELQILALKKAPNAGACYCITDIEITNLENNETQRVHAWKKTGEHIDTILPSMLASRWWGTSTALYRKETCDLAGPWQPWINEEDWEYDCRIGKANNNLCYVPKTLSVERQHTQSRLSNNGSTDHSKVCARVSAHTAIIGHALSVDFEVRTPEFINLLKGSFLLSRQCAAIGLTGESKTLLRLVAPLLIKANVNRKQLAIFRLATKIIGWRLAAKLALFTDRLRSQ